MWVMSFSLYSTLGTHLCKKNKKEEQMLRRLKLKCKTGENVFALSLKYTTVTQSILFSIFSICVAIMHCLNCSGLQSQKYFADYDPDIAVTLKKVDRSVMNC